MNAPAQKPQHVRVAGLVVRLSREADENHAGVGRDSGCRCPGACQAIQRADAGNRPEAVRGALGLEYFTVGWNVVEGVVAVVAALLAGSVALLGFGLDSFVECASGLVMIWRLRAEQRGRLSDAELDRTEHRARKAVAASLFALAAYVAADAIHSLIAAEHPSFSAAGAGLLVLSLLVMVWLARAKRKLAGKLGSGALHADAFQTTACWWLSLSALVGLGLNGALGWWWADPVAALAISAFVAREAREAWRGERCC